MTEELSLTFALLVIYQMKHFICDFPLQREYMMRKTLPGWEFFLPLTIHSAVHSFFTLIILLIFAPSLWYLFIYDFVIHFCMDRIKSGPKYLGRFNSPDKHSFWIALGFDQMVHHLTHYSIIYFVIVELYF
jgi:hypothetical protein